VSTYQTTRDALLKALKQYSSVLEERKAALAAISHTTTQIKQAISADGEIQLDIVLNQRGLEIGNYEQVNSRIGDELDRLIDAAQRCASDTSDEMYRTASSLIAMKAEQQSLAQNVLACQQECETMLKARLDVTAKAIRESRRRRKLDSAYGPAISHKSQPLFMDKQR
jgi:hypothetical protein